MNITTYPQEFFQNSQLETTNQVSLPSITLNKQSAIQDDAINQSQ